MSSKRPLVLMALLLGLLAVYVVRTQEDAVRAGWNTLLEQWPLPGENAITDVRIRRDGSGDMVADVTYYFTGRPPFAGILVHLVDAPGRPPRLSSSAVAPMRGTHRITVRLVRGPGVDAHVTERVIVSFRDQGQAIASRSIAHRIEWPAVGPTPADLLAQAIAAIDTNDRDQIRRARPLLEQVLEKEPRNAQAYLELARVAMKLNWGPEGLRQAEAFIASAMQIGPDNPNAQILLGYVYAHQGRYKDGEALLAQASRTDTKNLWLWANWGDLLELQGKAAEASAKYREAVARPPTLDPNDRARMWAYRKLILHYTDTKDFDALEALMKQRMADYANHSCHVMEYAKFLLVQRGDAPAAEAILQTNHPPCAGLDQRELRGLARYMKWAASQEPERAEALRLARVMLPVSARMLYTLAREERLLPVARELVAAGEKVGMQDNRGLDALAHALAAQDAAAARRLLSLGARPDALVGEDRMPVALIPVLSRDLSSIRVLQRAGVDYAKLRYQGMTALDHARQTGDAALLRALDPKTGSL